jgi:hypothetical protein
LANLLPLEHQATLREPDLRSLRDNAEHAVVRVTARLRSREVSVLDVVEFLRKSARTAFQSPAGTMEHNWKKVISRTLTIVMRRCVLKSLKAAERAIDAKETA